MLSWPRRGASSRRRWSAICLEIGRCCERRHAKGLVFLTILITVAVQGLSAPLLARRLGLVESDLKAALDTSSGLAAGLEQQPGGEQVGALEAAE